YSITCPAPARCRDPTRRSTSWLASPCESCSRPCGSGKSSTVVCATESFRLHPGLHFTPTAINPVLITGDAVRGGPHNVDAVWGSNGQGRSGTEARHGNARRGGQPVCGLVSRVGRLDPVLGPLPPRDQWPIPLR